MDEIHGAPLHEAVQQALRYPALSAKTLAKVAAQFDFTARMRMGRVLCVGEGNPSFALMMSRKPHVPISSILAPVHEAAEDLTDTAYDNARQLLNSGAASRPAWRARSMRARSKWTKRQARREAYLGSLPDLFQHLAERSTSEGHFQAVPDQVIINEYQPGQGIFAHIDCPPCFGGTIASLSLLSACVMRFASQRCGPAPVLFRSGAHVRRSTSSARPRS